MCEWKRLTDGEADLLLLIGQSVIIVEVKLQRGVPARQQLPLQAEQHTEVAFTAHQPDGITRRLQVSSHLKTETGRTCENAPTRLKAKGPTAGGAPALC